MQFLRTLLWVLLAVGIAIFATANWHDVMVELGGDLRMAIKLPLLFALTFLAGAVPPILYYRARLWKLRRRIDQAQRALEAQPTTPTPPSAPARPAAPPPEPDSPF
ncbi:hypothetical protein [Sphingomicrobium astaxanthinifaciens]|uniref:hypothetical protein n=1 Tax=Sphingomicrobium astaxanthinifaciens TaxID=1227949 RepID=UPI001FCB669A|nr:hypothetical protein [Sphingomicrobium astaxanthinifaciens]MCJ7421863.1 hypothetical protein [Sphingomicrobium astaxanthinifaciens]